MNKFVLLFVLTFAYVQAEGESSSSEEDIKSLATNLQSKLNTTLITDVLELFERTKKQCPEIEDKLETTGQDVITCIKSVELGDDTFCTMVRKNLEKCAEPVKKLLDGCLPEESKGLPIMGIKIISTIVDQVCNSTVEEIFELFNPCLMKKEFAAYETCTKFKDTAFDHKNKVPTKALVCKMVPNLTSCLKSHRDASCKNPVTKEAPARFNEAIQSVTTSECEDINKTE